MATDYTDIGIIGAGNMATAIVSGIIRGGGIPEHIHIFDIDGEKMNALSQRTGANIAKSNQEVVKRSNIIILAVKPQVYADLLGKLKDDITKDHIVVSIAAGISTQYIKNRLRIGNSARIVRIMPNMPALIGKGVIAVCDDSSAKQSDIETVTELFSHLGSIELVSEEDMNVITAISGSGPAYAFMFLEALADAAVMMGLSRDQAYRIAANMLIGAASMYKDTKLHPGELKDMVCSPAGTTIGAVYALEQKGFRGAIMSAVKECAKRGEQLSK
ncbi:MAG: pyrroline-5-carboxylate reductase [Clostridiales bacterium]|nr:pyrroline-5-carboxylate reductase [Clostridiales bacterium]